LNAEINRPIRRHQSSGGGQRIALASFFLLAYAWTWVCWWSLYAANSGYLSLPFRKELLATLGQFGPFAAALLVTGAVDGRSGLRELLSRLVRWRARPIWVLISLLLLPGTMLAAILLYAWLHGTLTTLQFRGTWSTLPAHFIYLLLVGGPLGEEPGWRGFALPRLQAQYAPVPANVFLGVLHACWHLPLWWLNGGPCPFWMYLAGVILVTFLFAWLFNHTGGSVFYSLLFHASMSTASMRLPEVPAYHLWVLCLLVVVITVFCCDPSLRQRPDQSAASEASADASSSEL
jgi:membrane protease YdiL (CAAX protease family)